MEYSLNGKQGRGLTSIFGHIDKDSDRKQFTILTSEKILQRLLIALAQVKASNTSEKLLN